MVTTNNDPSEFPNEISTSPRKAKFGVSLQPCQISGVQFPEELLYEIFLRLPVKSLIRFRCVSKGMRRLIDSPIFIKNHNIHRSVIIERDRSLSVSDESDDDEDYAIVLCQPILRRLFSLNFDKDDLNLNRAKAIQLNSSFAQEGKMEVMGWSCNGIFCFKNCYEDPTTSYVLWNPSNGTFRKVDCSARLKSYYASSMGYDCVNDDYKIIRFIASSETTSLEIYSFRKDSWRKIPVRDRDRDYSRGRYCYTSEVCLGGVIHWLWTNPRDKSMSIAAFDLATETFTSLALPLEARQLQLEPSHFTDLRGRLCLTLLPAGYPRRDRGPHGPQTIWVMEKYGVESSWSKLYNFGNTARGIRNFYFPNMKRRFLINNRWLSWWDPEDGSFEDIEIPGLLNDEALMPEVYYYEAYVYVRNLLRLDQTLV